MSLTENMQIYKILLNSVCKKTPTSSFFLQRIYVIYTSKRPKFVASKASNLTFSYQTLVFLRTLNTGSGGFNYCRCGFCSRC
jgi:hypothetical protein